jgi:hypothetical protein
LFLLLSSGQLREIRAHVLLKLDPERKGKRDSITENMFYQKIEVWGIEKVGKRLVVKGFGRSWY